MALTNIEYGSVASSATMNQNFSYLDDRITSSNTQISTSISSILSNIATINSRLTELSEDVTASIETLQSTIADYKNKTKLLVKNSGMVPNWASRQSISFTSGTNYTATANGFMLIFPSAAANADFTVNSVSTSLKTTDSNFIVLPVKSGDVVSTTMTCQSAYFVPAAEISVENF